MAVITTAAILENGLAEGGFYLMRLPFPTPCLPGQFVMLRLAGQLDPLLGRPISVFDWENRVVSLLYQPVGKGTKLLTQLRQGQGVFIQGPMGNGFPIAPGDATLIGGGVGIAPLYLLAKALKKQEPGRHIRIHLGFRERPALQTNYEAVCDELVLNIGGFVTDDVDFQPIGRTYYACGPTPMMRTAASRAKAKNATLYVSLEERMACGVGACLGCTCKTGGGNQRICKDGPVFLSGEVFLDV